MAHDIGPVEPGREFPVMDPSGDDDYVRPEVRSFTPPGLNLHDMGPHEIDAASDPDVGDGTPEEAPSLPASSWPGLATEPKTEGISPKVIVATATPLLVGLVLMILDLTGVIDVDDGLWLGLLGISLPVGGAAAAAKPGNVNYVRKDGGEL